MILPLPAFTDNYIWVIVNETSLTFTCVDPGDAAPVLTYARTNNLSLSHILLTHHHTDHTAGVADLVQAFPQVQVYGPRDERMNTVNVIVRDEDVVHIDQFDFRVLSIPGHTSTHICYQEPAKSWLFCGDTLFSAGCGRVFDGTIEQLHNSIQLLKNLPDNTQIYCGHEYTRQNLRFAKSIEPNNEMVNSYAHYLETNEKSCSLPSTIALEKKINPFMRTDSVDLQQFARTKNIITDNSLEIFQYLRKLKDNFK